MTHTMRKAGVIVGLVALIGVGSARGQDWPQWRGPNRDSKVTGFTEPKEWPKELTKKWKVKVGAGDASPVLVGDKIYAMAWADGNEFIFCLDAEKGTEVWKEKHETKASSGAAGPPHEGSRCAPVVADGKVFTLGLRGVVTCLDAAKGNVLWTKDTKAVPMFCTAASPMIVDGKCIAFSGGLVAYDVEKGDEKWKWSGEGAPYGSPVLMTVDKTPMIVTLTAAGRSGGGSLVGVGLADGKLLWKTSFTSRYNSVTPVVDGSTVILSTAGPGTIAYKIEKKDDTFNAKEAWKSSTASGMYNTPTLKDGLLYGLSARADEILKAELPPSTASRQTAATRPGPIAPSAVGAVASSTQVPSYFSSLPTPSWSFSSPGRKSSPKLAKYKVADSPTWAYSHHRREAHLREGSRFDHPLDDRVSAFISRLAAALGATR